MKFAFLVRDSSIVSFFSKFLKPTFVFEPLFIIIFIHLSKGKHEYVFPVKVSANKSLAMWLSIALFSVLISVENPTSPLS